MKKCKAFVIMLVAIIGLGSIVIPHAFGQVVNPNVRILSYSWYVDNSGDFIVVGELQNNGNSILTSATVNATAVDSSGTLIAGSYAFAMVTDLNVSQIAPFIINLGLANNNGYDWGPTVVSVKFDVYNAFSTSAYQYSDLATKVYFNSTLNGPYTLIGAVRNVGNQTANNINMVGTFYNSLGTVVGVGFDTLNYTLTPGNYTSFIVPQYDGTNSTAAQISNYSLLVQTSTLQGNDNGVPVGSSKPLPATEVYTLAVLGAVAIILVVVVLIIYRMRSKVPSAPHTPPQSSPPSPDSPPPPPPPTEE